MPCCCAAAGATAPKIIASATIALASAEIVLRRMREDIVIRFLAPHRGGSFPDLMILFAPALGKPVIFSSAAAMVLLIL